jgi:hypothetical protein
LRSANPLRERHLLQIANAAQWLCESDRDQFWAIVARELRDGELDHAGVDSAIAAALSAFGGLLRGAASS